MGLEVQVQYAIEDSQDVPEEALLSRWAEAAVDTNTSSELVIRIVSEEECAALNGAYRGVSRPTNVLSFPFEAPPQVEMSYLGDVVICAEVVKREATQQRKECLGHWAHMVIHGVLHLQGYDHQTDDQAQEMESREVKILAGLGYTDPYT